MEVRSHKKAKELAIKRFKEKIERDPSLAKTLTFAVDSCRTMVYQLDNCLSGLLNCQWEICKAGIFLNGLLKLFPTDEKEICLHNQANVQLITDQDPDTNSATSKNKQRSDAWFIARKDKKVTGSVVYTATGCEGLKKMNEHYDNVVCGVSKQSHTEQQQKAMQHGVDSEKHEIATLTGIVLPFMFPNLVYREEGFYVENGIMVSPYGSLQDPMTNKTQFAFKGKAPSGTLYCRQQYKVPERYITQTIFEQKVLKAKQGTLYLCYNDDSTTVFKVPVNDSIYTKCNAIIERVYMSELN